MKYPVPGKEFCYFFLHFLVEASTLEKPLAAENGPGAFPVSGKEFGIFGSWVRRPGSEVEQP